MEIEREERKNTRSDGVESLGQRLGVGHGERIDGEMSVCAKEFARVVRHVDAHTHGA